MARDSYLEEDAQKWLRKQTTASQHLQIVAALNRVQALLKEAAKKDGGGGGGGGVKSNEDGAEAAKKTDGKELPPQKSSTSQLASIFTQSAEMTTLVHNLNDVQATTSELPAICAQVEKIVGAEFNQVSRPVIHISQVLTGAAHGALGTVPPVFMSAKAISQMDERDFRKLNAMGLTIVDTISGLANMPDLGDGAVVAAHALVAYIATLKIPETETRATVPTYLFREDLQNLKHVIKAFFFDLTSWACVDPSISDETELQLLLAQHVHDMRARLGVAFAHYRATTKTSSNELLQASYAGKMQVQGLKSVAATQQQYASEAMNNCFMDLSATVIGSSWKGVITDPHKADWIQSGAAQYRAGGNPRAAAVGNSGSPVGARAPTKHASAAIGNNNNHNNRNAAGGKKDKRVNVPRAQAEAALAAIQSNGFLTRRSDPNCKLCWWCAEKHAARSFSQCPAFQTQAKNGGHSLDAVLAAIEMFKAAQK
jgi:hypothetical protein